ncbi:actin-binding protein WASF3-like isoform X2 [Amphiura filiformis]|uniref:actin-binding protein WASF3-like isoform X2 n=1 Tax=Amphiura filiformis TaxID=82378 RepID=UPI003B222A93
MPLVKREIQPVFVSRGLDVIPKGITNELECVTNCTLSSVIRQLSNLARHAEDVFAELYTEANFVFKKSNALQDRIDRLSVKVTQLDSVHDEDTLEGYMSQIPYHNTFNTGDQVILDNGTLPLALQETRALCEKVPSLSLLDPYREDGKEALKMYTNPKYFFELWCQDMQKNINEDEKKKEKGKESGGKETEETSPTNQLK